jgi:hypothetical protein
MSQLQVAQLGRKDSAELVFGGLRKHRGKVTISTLVAAVALVSAAVIGRWTASEVLGGVGLFVSVAGFGLALWVLLEAVGVSAASQTAMRDTLETVLATRLHGAVIELFHITEAMESAAVHDDRATARSLLSRWSWRAAEISGLLRSRYGKTNEFEEALERSAEAILDAKNGLYEPESDTRTATKQAAEAMEAVCGQLGPLLGELSPLHPIGVEQ